MWENSRERSDPRVKRVESFGQKGASCLEMSIKIEPLDSILIETRFREWEGVGCRDVLEGACRHPDKEDIRLNYPGMVCALSVVCFSTINNCMLLCVNTSRS